MFKIAISHEIKEAWNSIAIASVQAKVKVKESPLELKTKIQQASDKVEKLTAIEDISKHPVLQDGRRAYKAFGKDPARYRISSEALLRRIVKGKGIYFVNNIVDINNLLSIQSAFPICAFDKSDIHPPVVFRIGKKDEEYEGIGRGVLNIEGLPVFADEKGSFGSPTSDSERVKIKESTTDLWMNIVSFSGNAKLEKWMLELRALLEEYAFAEDVHAEIID